MAPQPGLGSMKVDLLPDDQYFWGRRYHTVLSTWMRPDGRLGVFFTDGLTITVNPDELQEVK